MGAKFSARPTFRSRIFFAVLLGLSLAMLVPSSSFAQDPAGTATGTIKDLGTDTVYTYRLDTSEGTLAEVSQAHTRPGAGPRHLAFHPTLPLVFVTNELDSTVATLRFDAESGKLSQIDSRSTLPAGWTGTNYPADIHVAANGRTLYVSNRGHNSIAVFSLAQSGALALVQVVSTEGDWPRNFSLDPTGRWLLVANQRSDSVIVFARDQKNGRLTLTPQRMALPSPVCLRFA